MVSEVEYTARRYANRTEQERIFNKCRGFFTVSLSSEIDPARESQHHVTVKYSCS